MPRSTDHYDSINADSFLDIIASVVSIMLIMVMIIGMRIRNSSVEDAVAAAISQTEEKLQEELGKEESLRGDVLAVAHQIESIKRETAVKAARREALGLTVAALEHNIRTRREELNAGEQRNHDLVRTVAMARQQVAALDAQREAIERAQSPPVVIQSFPTPISRPVDDFETHFQLRGGRIIHIPLDALVQEFKADVMRQVQKLRGTAELTDVVGPIGGFRLKYTMVRSDVTLDGAVVAAGARAELQRWTLLPLSDDLGETVAEALESRSEFRRALSKCSRERGAITIWVYVDSFDAFRRLREELYTMGYRVAARPLPMDAPISGSPEGTKSSAQ